MPSLSPVCSLLSATPAGVIEKGDYKSLLLFVFACLVVGVPVLHDDMSPAQAGTFKAGDQHHPPPQ
jgi:hypothetical protein